jgi:formate dehydrogenase subunit gamma
MSFETDPGWNPEQAQQRIDSLKEKPGSLRSILTAIQNDQGYIHPDSLSLIADGLEQPVADIKRFVSRSPRFRTYKPGRHLLQLCCAKSCRLKGAEQLACYVKQRLQIENNQTTEDGHFTLEPAHCLGNCSLAPELRVNGERHGPMTPQSLKQLLDRLES